MRLRKMNLIVHYSYLPTYSSLIAWLITPLVLKIKLWLTSLPVVSQLSTLSSLHCSCYDHNLGSYLDYPFSLFLPLCWISTLNSHRTQSHQYRIDPYGLYLICYLWSCLTALPSRFIRLTYLMPRFTSYCCTLTTLDLVPIHLVVDCPSWTSLYI